MNFRLWVGNFEIEGLDTAFCRKGWGWGSSLFILFYFILHFLFFWGGRGEGGGLGGGGIKQESKETAECMHTYQNLLMTFPNATNI